METILKEFETKTSLLEEFKSKVEGLLQDLLNANSLRFHQISSRLKNRESLSKKLLTKQGYSSLSDITDIVGCRIITYFEDEVDKIAQIISREFIIDPENSIDKRKIEFDRFGYLSLHYVVELNKTRLKLTEYKKFRGIKFEIQIRSILQHSWAEIEHDIGYKGRYSIPDIVKRRFSRISALLETADLEFVRLRNELINYEKSVGKEIKDNPENVTLNQASLFSFISNNRDLKRVDRIIADILDIDLKGENNFTEEQINLLEFAGIRSIGELNNLYKTNSKCIIEFANAWRERSPRIKKERNSGIHGLSIYDAAYYLISKNKDKSEMTEFFREQLNGRSNRKPDGEIKRCLEALSKVNPNCR